MGDLNGITFDNIQLSKAKNRLPDTEDMALKGYLQEAFAINTRRAYRADMDHFHAWGGEVPCSPRDVAQYLSDQAEDLAIATLSRRLVSIGWAHSSRNFNNPCKDETVKAIFRGIKRKHGRPQQQAKPLTSELLLRIVNRLPYDLLGSRDKCLLLLGFAGGFRRSELVSLDLRDLEFVPQGMKVHLQRSKTDQIGTGRKIGIPYASGTCCPVIMTQDWLARANVESGPLFRSVRKGDLLQSKRLSGSAVSEIVKRAVQLIGLEPAEYSGHSLRAGLVTSAASHGFQSWQIKRQTGHRSDVSLQAYIRESQLFNNNVVSKLL